MDDAQLTVLRSLSLSALPALEPSRSNRVADDPRAAAFGHTLFFDEHLSASREIACVTCHEPARFFTDGLARSVGIRTLARNAPTVVGAAYSPWMFWDGRRDSLWAQALAPLESPGEMGATRVEVVRRATTAPEFAKPYRALFGAPPDLRGIPEHAGPFGDEAAAAAWSRLPARRIHEIDLAFANVGKALEAYQRQLLPAAARFDRAVDALAAGDASAARTLLSKAEWAGARLFADASRTQCLRCHNGPLFTNQAFHRVGTASGGALPDFGRFLGIQALLVDPFNCLGAYSDAKPDECDELRFVNRGEIGHLNGAFKTPTLRGVADTAPYMHDGRHATLEQVIDHYRDPPARRTNEHELTPLEISDTERDALVAFLGTLSGGVAADPRWLVPPR